jgi:hypothetical protein
LNETPNPAPRTPEEIDAALDARPKLVDGLHPGSPEALGAYFELSGVKFTKYSAARHP